MAHTPTILRWIREYGIKSILNAPGGARSDEGPFLEAGAKEVLSIDMNGACPITADLCFWKPDRGFDAVFINCVFCTSNVSPTGDHVVLAKNYASWPVKYILLFDTKGFDWEPHFREAGWYLLENEPLDGRIEIGQSQIWSKKKEGGFLRRPVGS